MLTNFPIDNSRGSIQYPYGKFIDKTREYFDRVFRNHNWIQEDAGHDMITDNQSGIRWYRMDPELNEYVPGSSAPFLLDNTPWNHHEMWELSESGVSYVYQHTPSLNNPHHTIFHRGNPTPLDRIAESGKIYKNYYELHELNETEEINSASMYALRGLKIHNTSEQIGEDYLDAYSWLENNGQDAANLAHSGYLDDDYTVSNTFFDTVLSVYKESDNNIIHGNTTGFSFTTTHRNAFITALIPLSRSCFVDVSGLQTNYSVENIFGSIDINLEANAKIVEIQTSQGNNLPNQNAAQAWFGFNIDNDKGSISIGFIDTSGWIANNKNTRHAYYPTPYSHPDNLEIFNQVVEDMKANNHTVIVDTEYTQNLRDTSNNQFDVLEEGAFESDYYRCDYVSANAVSINSSCSSSGIPTTNPISATIPENLLKNTSKNTMYIALHPTNIEIQNPTTVNLRPYGDLGELSMFGTEEGFRFNTGRGAFARDGLEFLLFNDNLGEGRAGWRWNEKMYKIS